jgi:3-polyprenyl-4-hydroxybenzoate decarboxylase
MYPKNHINKNTSNLCFENVKRAQFLVIMNVSGRTDLFSANFGLHANRQSSTGN